MPVYRVIPAGDLFVENHRFARHEGIEQIRARLSRRLKFFQGEWFNDLRQGMPYYRDVLVWNPNLSVIRSLFRKAIIGTPGVLSLPVLTLSFDSPNRTLSVSFQAVCEGGTITVEPGDDDFLVDVPLA